MDEFEELINIVCPKCFAGRTDAKGYGFVIQATASHISQEPTERYDEEGDRLYKVIKEPIGSRRFLVYINKYDEPVALVLSENDDTPEVLARGIGVLPYIEAALRVASETAPACTGECTSRHPHEEAIRVLLPK